jgi:hypothetical protein
MARTFLFKNPTIEQLNNLRDIPMEEWYSSGISLAACSANSHGTVSGGILAKNRKYFSWDYSKKTYVFDGIAHN